MSARLIARMSEPEPNSGCWIWAGANDRTRYGRVRVCGERWRPNRLSWAVHVGPIPDGLHVCHKCDNPQKMWIEYAEQDFLAKANRHPAGIFRRALQSAEVQ